MSATSARIRAVRTSAAAIALLASACRTPEPAPAPAPQPRDWRMGVQEQTTIDKIDRSNVIPYRILTREDFQGTQVPNALAGHQDQVGAATCAYVAVADGVRLNARQTGPRAFEVSTEALHFEAKM